MSSFYAFRLKCFGQDLEIRFIRPIVLFPLQPQPESGQEKNGEL